MPIITVQEILDLVIMVAAIGFIFKDRFEITSLTDYDPLKELMQRRNFFGKGFQDAVIVAAPAVVLHEAGHKIAAMSFGLDATFHAAYTWLGIGVVLKLIGAPFLFFVPGYVSYSGFIQPLAHALIAFAGPLVNLLLFLLATLALRQNMLKKHSQMLVLTKQINLFLFAFNMIPIGFFDGAQVFRDLLQML